MRLPRPREALAFTWGHLLHLTHKEGIIRVFSAAPIKSIIEETTEKSKEHKAGRQVLIWMGRASYTKACVYRWLHIHLP